MAVAFAYAQRMLDEGRVPASRTCLECFMHLYILYYNTYIYIYMYVCNVMLWYGMVWMYVSM